MHDDVKESIFHALSQADEMLLCIDTATGRTLYTNDYLLEVMGNKEQSEGGTMAFRDMLVTGREDFDRAIQVAVATGKYTATFTMSDGSGNKRLINARFSCAAGKDGHAPVVTMVATDTCLYNPTDKKYSDFAGENFSILDNIKDVFFSLDRNGYFLFYNKAFARYIQTMGVDVTNKTIWEVFPDAKGLLFENAWHQTIDDQTSVEFEELLPSLGRWLSILTYPTTAGMSVFVHDITRKKENNDLLIQSERKFHLMSDNSPMFIWTFDEHLNPVFYNKTFLDFAGMTMESLMDEGWMTLLHEDDFETARREWDDGIFGRKEISIECRLQRHDSVYRWIKLTGTPQIDAAGALMGYLVNGVDITDLKYYYETLEGKNRELGHALNESRRLSEILNKTTNILVLTDVEGKITWVNNAFTKYKEYTLAEVIGKKPGPLVYGPETSLDTINILHEGIQKKEITRVEILNYSKTGVKMWLDVRIEPIFKNGIPEGYMAIEMDISKRKKDELAIKERNEKIKEFSFITSHDLRHEFSKVMMLLNLAKTKEYTVDDYKALFIHLEAPVNRINHIISKINSNLYLGDISDNITDRLNEMDEIKEICLVDDDELTNMIHKQIIKIILPQTPIRVYDSVEGALSYLKIQPHNNRIIFLDLMFMNGKSGWDFLDEYEKLEFTAPVIILSSSIDNDDLARSKKYRTVLEYFVKPLTAETLHKYIKKTV